MPGWLLQLEKDENTKRMPFALVMGIIVITLLLAACIAVTAHLAFTRPDLDRGAGIVCVWGLMWVLWDISNRWRRK